MRNNRLSLAFEAINVQRSSQLFNELTAHLENILANAVMTGKEIRGHLDLMSAAILKNTGINTTLHVEDNPVPNAWVTIPMIDRNHPLLIDFYREVSNNREGLKQIKKSGGVFSGAIDREKSKVSGGFSKVEIDIHFNRGLLAGQFSAQEIAGIALHELGHIFTYFEYLGTNITTNYVLQHVSRSLLATREVKRRYEIIEEGTSALGIEIEDTEALTRCDNDVVIQTVLLREVVKKRYSELSSPTYDMTAWEMLSDQFATRHGAGRSLVTGLDKMYRMAGAQEYRGTAGFLMVEAFKVLMLLVAGAFTFMLVPFLLLFVVDPTEDLYDRPKSRMERVRRDLVDALKARDLDKAFRTQLLQDVEVIDKVLTEMTERRGYLEFIWTTLRTRTKYNYQQLRFQQELEMLANNELFVKSAKLKSLSL